MPTMTKLALVTASVLSMGALTACQSTPTPQDVGPTAHGYQKHHGHQKHHADKRGQHLTPEQREQFKQGRAERQQVMKQIQQACEGKAAGQTVQIKANDKSINGSCQIRFVPDRAAMKKDHGQFAKEGKFTKDAKFSPEKMAPHRAESRTARGEPLTEAQQAEKKKLLEQRMAQRKAHQQAIQQACQGKSNGQSVQIKVSEQNINGQCKVLFQPQHQPGQFPAKAAVKS